MPIVFSLAWRFLRSGQKKQKFIALSSWFSLIGIMLGVGTLIVVMSVMNGFRHDLLERILGLHAHIQLQAYSYDYEPNKLADILQGDDSIKTFSPVFEGHVIASNTYASGGALVRVMHVNDIMKRDALKQAIIHGNNWEESLQKGQIAIGAPLARRYNLRVGDDLRLIAPNVAKTALGAIPRSKTYIIGGIFQIGMHEYDNNIIFMNWADGTKFFQLPTVPARYEIILKNPNNTVLTTDNLSKKVDSEFHIDNWMTRNSSLVQALAVERNVMFIILTLIILVAAFNIISAQVMIVQHKESSIAILRALGAPKKAILQIFLISGLYLGFIGTFLGVVGGTLFAFYIEEIRQFLQLFIGQNLFSPEIYYLTSLPVRIHSNEVALVALIATLITLIAALLPALKAANINPINILRHYT